MNKRNNPSGLTFHSFTNAEGITLVEILVTLFSTAIVAGGVLILLRSSLDSFTNQEKHTDMEQNSYAIITTLIQDFQQAGYKLPSVNDVIKPITHDSIQLEKNITGGYHLVSSDLNSVSSVSVEDASVYKNLTKVPYLNYNYGDYFWDTLQLSGVDTIHNQLLLSSGTEFHIGDIIYTPEQYIYFFNSTEGTIEKRSLLHNTTSVVGENVESLSITFLDSLGNQTTKWNTMKSCSLCVSVRPVVKSSGSENRLRCRKFYLRNQL